MSKFITEAELIKRAPVVATEGNGPKASDKYVHVSTIDVVRDLEKLGWKPTKAFQLNSWSKNKKGYQKHMIIFENPDIVQDKNYIPEIVLTNSHDAKCSFRLEAGLFDKLVSERFLICTEDFGSLRIRHIHYSFDQLRAAVNSLVALVPDLHEKVKLAKKTTISDIQKNRLLEQAVNIRFNPNRNYVYDITNSFLVPTNSIWDIFRAIQNSLIDGGVHYTNEKGQKKETKEIKSFHRAMKIRRAIWELIISKNYM